MAQTAPFGTLVGKTREKAQLAFGFNLVELTRRWSIICSFAWKGSIWYARDMSNCDYGFQRTPPCSSFVRLSHQESQIWRASQIFMVMKVLSRILSWRKGLKLKILNDCNSSSCNVVLVMPFLVWNCPNRGWFGSVWNTFSQVRSEFPVDHLNHHKVLDCVPLWFKALYSQLLGYTAARSIKLFKVIALDYIITALCTST